MSPDYQYWTIFLLDFNICHLGAFALVHLRNLCSFIFLFLFLLGKHGALEGEAEGKVFDIFVLSPAVRIGREREHMALWKPTCNSENPLPKTPRERQTERFGWKRSSHLTVAETLMLSSPQVGKIPVNRLPVQAALLRSANWLLFSCFCLYIQTLQVTLQLYRSLIRQSYIESLNMFIAFFSLKLIFSFHSKTILPQEIFLLPSTFWSNQAYFCKAKK